MTALEFDHVSRDYVTPDGRAYRVIDDVSLAIRAGAFVALVGPSGCGKSTLLNLAAGLLFPTSGTIHSEGEELVGLNRRATYMFQQDALLPWKNVRANVALGLTLTGMKRADADARADALARTGRADGVRVALPVSIERWHAQTRHDGAELDPRPKSGAHGRTIQRP